MTEMEQTMLKALIEIEKICDGTPKYDAERYGFNAHAIGLDAAMDAVDKIVSDFWLTHPGLESPNV